MKEVIGIAFETFTETSTGVLVPYFLQFEDGTLDSTQREVFIRFSELELEKHLPKAQKLFLITKYLENPSRRILNEIAKEALKIENKKAS